MLLPLTLGCLHALEPDHVAVVTGVAVDHPKGAWKVGLAFGASHMAAVALLAVLSAGLGHAVFGDVFFTWLDRCAWAFVALLGLWNLAAALGWRDAEVHAHAHAHGPLVHDHAHEHGEAGHGAGGPAESGAAPASRHRFHHGMAWLGAFFGLGGFRGFASLMREGAHAHFAVALLLFGIGITAVFILLSWASGLLAARLGSARRFRRVLFAASGVGNLAVGLWLFLRP
jgi:ABC-type nickel/cobalt efflux system permease component RcnA